MKWIKRIVLLNLLITLLAVGGAYLWMRGGLAPTPKGDPFYLRIESGQGFGGVVRELERRGVVRNQRAFILHATLFRKVPLVKVGTYSFAAGMTADQILESFEKPVRQMVRIPETNFSMRTANLLAMPKYQVCEAEDYLAATRTPADYAKSVPFPLPKEGTMEGFLYPDTYDLPPLLGAEGVVRRQLNAFEAKAWPLLKDHPDPYKILKIASLIELEVALDKERALVAGVIYNRIDRKMSLGIDAALNYALGEWRPLTKADLQIDSPYNLRRFAGLPPTPICSPTAESIKAALKPAKHDFLFYVVSGKPDKSHRFARTNAEHEQNKRLWRQTMGNSQ